MVDDDAGLDAAERWVDDWQSRFEEQAANACPDAHCPDRMRPRRSSATLRYANALRSLAMPRGHHRSALTTRGNSAVALPRDDGD